MEISDSESHSKRIGDIETCKAAAISLAAVDPAGVINVHRIDDLEAMQSYGVPTNIPPGGCSMADRVLTYNFFPMGNGCSFTKSCICMVSSPCANTFGATANVDACFCGSTLCTSTTGLYCFAVANLCETRAHLDCTIEYANASNSNGCKCGTNSCTATTGLYCISNISICSKGI